ncbi:MAG: hypothetical protein ACLQQ4_19110 [Bacteroidia bacterium]
MSAEYFYQEMKSYMEEYLKFLRKSKVIPKEIDTQYDVLFFFIELIYHHEMCTGFEDITVAMTNSRLRTFYTRQTSKLLTEKACKSILRGFFEFIYDKYGVKSDKVMKAVGKK